MEVDALGQLYDETMLQQGLFLDERTVHQDVAKGTSHKKGLAEHTAKVSSLVLKLGYEWKP